MNSSMVGFRRGGGALQPGVTYCRRDTSTAAPRFSTLGPAIAASEQLGQVGANGEGDGPLPF